MSTKLAINIISPAINQTIPLLWPPNTGRWIRLIIISFFIGGLLSCPFPDISLKDIPGITNMQNIDLISGPVGIISSFIAGILLVLLIYSFFSSVFQFVFVDYISSFEKRLIPLFKTRLIMGIRLLFFYLATILLITICAGTAILFIAIPALTSNSEDPFRLITTLVYTLLGLFILIIPVWVMTLLTNDFVVPVMMVRNCGLINGWQIIINEFKGHWIEIAFYLLIKIVIYVIAGIIIGIIIGILGTLSGFTSMMIPGTSGYHTYTNLSGAFLFLIIALVTLIMMTPVLTFFRIYSLLFLGKLSENFSLLKDVSEHQKLCIT